MPKHAYDSSSGTRFIVTEDCEDPRFSKIRVPCDEAEVALTIRDFLAQEHILGTIHEGFLVYEVFDDLTLCEWSENGNPSTS